MSIAFKKSLFDEVDERKVHRGVVPRLGGISFLPSFLFALCVVLGFNLQLSTPGFQEEVMKSVIPIFFLFCALVLMYLVGLADDLVGVRYRAKFLFQILAGALIVTSGCWIQDVDGFLGFMEWPDMAGWLVTVVLVIYVTNAINLIDGIDGLASGLSIIALGFYSYVFYIAQEYVYALMAGATLGALLPFFYYNVFGSADRRNKIFMGDTGSLTIGLMLAFLSIETLNLSKEAMPDGENLFVISVAPILVPCFDVVRVFFHRVRNSRNPFLPDSCHIHHKLLALGMRQWHTLLIILVSDVGLILLNLSLSQVMSPSWIIFGDLMVWVLLNVLITRMIRQREVRIGVQLYN